MWLIHPGGSKTLCNSWTKYPSVRSSQLQRESCTMDASAGHPLETGPDAGRRAIDWEAHGKHHIQGQPGHSHSTQQSSSELVQPARTDSLRSWSSAATHPDMVHEDICPVPRDEVFEVFERLKQDALQPGRQPADLLVQNVNMKALVAKKVHVDELFVYLMSPYHSRGKPRIFTDHEAVAVRFDRCKSAQQARLGLHLKKVEDRLIHVNLIATMPYDRDLQNVIPGFISYGQYCRQYDPDREIYDFSTHKFCTYKEYCRLHPEYARSSRVSRPVAASRTQLTTQSALSMRAPLSSPASASRRLPELPNPKQGNITSTISPKSPSGGRIPVSTCSNQARALMSLGLPMSRPAGHERHRGARSAISTANNNTETSMPSSSTMSRPVSSGAQSSNSASSNTTEAIVSSSLPQSKPLNNGAQSSCSACSNTTEAPISSIVARSMPLCSGAPPSFITRSNTTEVRTSSSFPRPRRPSTVELVITGMEDVSRLPSSGGEDWRSTLLPTSKPGIRIRKRKQHKARMDTVSCNSSGTSGVPLYGRGIKPTCGNCPETDFSVYWDASDYGTENDDCSCRDDGDDCDDHDQGDGGYGGNNHKVVVHDDHDRDDDALKKGLEHVGLSVGHSACIAAAGKELTGVNEKKGLEQPGLMTTPKKESEVAEQRNFVAAYTEFGGQPKVLATLGARLKPARQPNSVAVARDVVAREELRGDSNFTCASSKRKLCIVAMNSAVESDDGWDWGRNDYSPCSEADSCGCSLQLESQLHHTCQEATSHLPAEPLRQDLGAVLCSRDRNSNLRPPAAVRVPAQGMFEEDNPYDQQGPYDQLPSAGSCHQLPASILSDHWPSDSDPCEQLPGPYQQLPSDSHPCKLPPSALVLCGQPPSDSDSCKQQPSALIPCGQRPSASDPSVQPPSALIPCSQLLSASNLCDQPPSILPPCDQWPSGPDPCIYGSSVDALDCVCPGTFSGSSPYPTSAEAPWHFVPGGLPLEAQSVLQLTTNSTQGDLPGSLAVMKVVSQPSTDTPEIIFPGGFPAPLQAQQVVDGSVDSLKGALSCGFPLTEPAVQCTAKPEHYFPGAVSDAAPQLQSVMPSSTAEPKKCFAGACLTAAPQSQSVGPSSSDNRQGCFPGAFPAAGSQPQSMVPSSTSNNLKEYFPGAFPATGPVEQPGVGSPDGASLSGPIAPQVLTQHCPSAADAQDWSSHSNVSTMNRVKPVSLARIPSKALLARILPAVSPTGSQTHAASLPDLPASSASSSTPSSQSDAGCLCNHPHVKSDELSASLYPALAKSNAHCLIVQRCAEAGLASTANHQLPISAPTDSHCLQQAAACSSQGIEPICQVNPPGFVQTKSLIQSADQIVTKVQAKLDAEEMASTRSPASHTSTSPSIYNPLTLQRAPAETLSRDEFIISGPALPNPNSMLDSSIGAEPSSDEHSWESDATDDIVTNIAIMYNTVQAGTQHGHTKQRHTRESYTKQGHTKQDHKELRTPVCEHEHTSVATGPNWLDASQGRCQTRMGKGASRKLRWKQRRRAMPGVELHKASVMEFEQWRELQPTWAVGELLEVISMHAGLSSVKACRQVCKSWYAAFTPSLRALKVTLLPCKPLSSLPFTPSKLSLSSNTSSSSTPSKLQAVVSASVPATSAFLPATSGGGNGAVAHKFALTAARGTAENHSLVDWSATSIRHGHSASRSECFAGFPPLCHPESHIASLPSLSTQMKGGVFGYPSVVPTCELDSSAPRAAAAIPQDHVVSSGAHPNLAGLHPPATHIPLSIGQGGFPHPRVANPCGAEPGGLEPTCAAMQSSIPPGSFAFAPGISPSNFGAGGCALAPTGHTELTVSQFEVGGFSPSEESSGYDARLAADGIPLINLSNASARNPFSGLMDWTEDAAFVSPLNLLKVLPRFTSLKCLGLLLPDLPPADDKQSRFLCGQLQQLWNATCLTSLSISELVNNSFRLPTKQLSHLTKLKELELLCLHHPRELVFLATSLTNLTSLALSTEEVQGSSKYRARHLEALGALPRLSQLGLVLSRQFSGEFLEAVCTLSKLQSLTMKAGGQGYNNITAVGVRSLSKLCQLTRLDCCLLGECMKPYSYQAWGDAWRHGLEKLQGLKELELVLPGCSFSLVNALLSHPSLDSIRLELMGVDGKFDHSFSLSHQQQLQEVSANRARPMPWVHLDLGYGFQQADWAHMRHCMQCMVLSRLQLDSVGELSRAWLEDVVQLSSLQHLEVCRVNQVAQDVCYRNALTMLGLLPGLRTLKMSFTRMFSSDTHNQLTYRSVVNDQLLHDLAQALPNLQCLAFDCCMFNQDYCSKLHGIRVGKSDANYILTEAGLKSLFKLELQSLSLRVPAKLCSLESCKSSAKGQQNPASKVDLLPCSSLQHLELVVELCIDASCSPRSQGTWKKFVHALLPHTLKSLHVGLPGLHEGTAHVICTKLTQLSELGVHNLAYKHAPRAQHTQNAQQAQQGCNTCSRPSQKISGGQGGVCVVTPYRLERNAGRQEMNRNAGAIATAGAQSSKSHTDLKLWDSLKELKELRKVVLKKPSDWHTTQAVKTYVSSRGVDLQWL